VKSSAPPVAVGAHATAAAGRLAGCAPATEARHGHSPGGWGGISIDDAQCAKAEASMTCAAASSIGGLLANFAGVILLFRYGMPYRVRTGGSYTFPRKLTRRRPELSVGRECSAGLG
jgi:hypothetical protein